MELKLVVTELCLIQQTLLIEPYGIEIVLVADVLPAASPFNRTLWN